MATRMLDDKPLVSFILTCYNLPTEMVKECLDSILRLSLRPFEREIILVDDGSKGHILTNLKEYGNDIIYVRQKNQGLSVARNTGIRIATGRYMQFVDADDKLIFSAYERCLDIVRFNSPDMVLFKSSNNEHARSSYTSPEETDGTSYLLNNNLRSPAWGFIFKKDILSDLRFTPGLLHEDEEFTPLLLLRAKSVFSTNIKAYFYRERSCSITHSKNKRMLVKRLDDVESTIWNLKEIALSLPSDKSQALQRRVAQLSMEHIFNVMRLTRSSSQLKRRLERLENNGLFPIPDSNYTTLYEMFRKLINNKITRKLLFHITLR